MFSFVQKNYGIQSSALSKSQSKPVTIPPPKIRAKKDDFSPMFHIEDNYFNGEEDSDRETYEEARRNGFRFIEESLSPPKLNHTLQADLSSPIKKPSPQKSEAFAIESRSIQHPPIRLKTNFFEIEIISKSNQAYPSTFVGKVIFFSTMALAETVVSVYLLSKTILFKFLSPLQIKQEKL